MRPREAASWLDPRDHIKPLAVDQGQKPLGRDLVRGHDVAVNVEAHRRPRVPGPLRKLPSGDPRLVPDRDPPVP